MDAVEVYRVIESYRGVEILEREGGYYCFSPNRASPCSALNQARQAINRMLDETAGQAGDQPAVPLRAW